MNSANNKIGNMNEIQIRRTAVTAENAKEMFTMSCTYKHYYILQNYRNFKIDLTWEEAGDKLLLEKRDDMVNYKTEAEVLSKAERTFPVGFTMKDVKDISLEYKRRNMIIMTHYKKTGKYLKLNDFDKEDSKK